MTSLSEIPTLVLCGGRGTRAYPHTAELPKPLLDVGDEPILRHVMNIYASQGARRFVLAAGFRADMIDEFAKTLPDEWDVDVIDTGEDTDKAERVRLCRGSLDEQFFMTYGDGVGDVDLSSLLAFHDAHSGAATVTVVPLPSQYGTLELDDAGRVSSFREKPVLDEHWINAGFFVVDERAFDHWVGADLEGDVLPALGREGDLFAYRHTGFWRSMDTYKEAIELTELAEAHGRPPWIR